MKMPDETYEQGCKGCPSLTDCMDKGVGCPMVITNGKYITTTIDVSQSAGTYSAGHNEEFTILKMIEPLDRVVVFKEE